MFVAEAAALDRVGWSGPYLGSPPPRRPFARGAYASIGRPFSLVTAWSGGVCGRSRGVSLPLARGLAPGLAAATQWLALVVSCRMADTARLSAARRDYVEDHVALCRGDRVQALGRVWETSFCSAFAFGRRLSPSKCVQWGKRGHDSQLLWRYAGPLRLRGRRGRASATLWQPRCGLRAAHAGSCGACYV